MRVPRRLRATAAVGLLAVGVLSCSGSPVPVCPLRYPPGEGALTPTGDDPWGMVELGRRVFGAEANLEVTENAMVVEANGEPKLFFNRGTPGVVEVDLNYGDIERLNEVGRKVRAEGCNVRFTLYAGGYKH